jgi:hypothetical protein
MILTLGGLGIWALIDLIILTLGSFRDSDDLRVFLWLEPGSVTAWEFKVRLKTIPSA